MIGKLADIPILLAPAGALELHRVHRHEPCVQLGPRRLHKEMDPLARKTPTQPRGPNDRTAQHGAIPEGKNGVRQALGRSC